MGIIRNRLAHFVEKPPTAEPIQTTDMGPSVPIQVVPTPAHLVSLSYGHASSYCPRSLAGGPDKTGTGGGIDTIHALAILQLRTETRRKKRTKRRRLAAAEPRMYYGQEQFGSNQDHPTPIQRPSAKMRYRMTFKNSRPAIAPSKDASATATFSHDGQHDLCVRTETIHQIDTKDVAMDDHPYDAEIEPAHTNSGSDHQIPTH